MKKNLGTNLGQKNHKYRFRRSGQIWIPILYLTQFFNMVKTQFSFTIKTFHIDNAAEYKELYLLQFFAQ